MKVDYIEAMKLALEALETVTADVKTTPTAYEAQRQAITALREALVNEALDKKAENARELGLDYEPAQQEPVLAIRLLTNQCFALIQERDELQEQVWRYEKNGVTCQTYRHKVDASCAECNVHEVYASPPAQQEPVAYDKTEINCFAQDLYDQKMREGKHGHYESMFHVIHQCIKKGSPTAQQEPVADVGLLEYKGNSVSYIHQKMKAYRNGIDAAWDAMRAKGLHPDGKTSLADMIAKYTSPPASKPWVDLTDEQIDDIYQGAGKNDLKRARQVIAAFKEKNT